jgi:hypothetical protein
MGPQPGPGAPVLLIGATPSMQPAGGSRLRVNFMCDDLTRLPIRQTSKVISAIIAGGNVARARLVGASLRTPAIASQQL